MKTFYLPHYNERQTNIDTLVIHCSAQSSKQMLTTLDTLKLSTHYIIGPKGGIIKCVDEEKRAWHAGQSFWRNNEDINSCSIGIEMSSPLLGQYPYTPRQINTLKSLCSDIIKRYNIPSYNIVGHSDIAPTRKPDPGLAFAWQELACSGIGIWYNIKDAKKILITDIAKLLSLIGYNTKDYQTTQASAYAFCRRFLPQFVKIENDINKLIDNILPDDFSFMNEAIFIKILQAVAYAYCKASNTPCKI